MPSPHNFNPFLVTRRQLLLLAVCVSSPTIAWSSYTPNHEEVAKKILHGFHNLKIAQSIGEYITNHTLLEIDYTSSAVINQILLDLELSPSHIMQMSDTEIESRIAQHVVSDFEAEIVLESLWLLSMTEAHIYLLAYLVNGKS